MFRQLLTIGVLSVFSFGLIGCGGGEGPDLARVEGTVTHNGQPLAGATVIFHPNEGALATGTTDSDGEFTLTTAGRPGAVLGPHKVSVKKAAEGGQAAATQALTPDDMRKMQIKTMKGGPGATSTPKSEIPARYADPEKSQLTATVDSDESKNVFEFPLVD